MIPLPSWLQNITRPITQAGQNAVRMATTNPAVAPLIRAYRGAPAAIREGLNPLTRTGTTTLRGGVGANALNLLRDTALVTAAEKFLPKQGQDTLNSALAAEWYLQLGRIDPRLAIVQAVFEPLPVGATENDMIIRERRKYEQAKLAAAKEEATQTALGLGTPPPAGGNRVDATTRQASVAPPQQSARMEAPAQQIPMAAYQAAVTTGMAPTSVPLSDFYRAQEHIGKYMEESGELQRRLKDIGGARGMSDQALMDWAQKNPALAYREMFKLEKRVRDQEAQAAQPSV